MKNIEYNMYRDILLEGFDGKMCRISPKAFCTPDGRLHIDYTMLLLTGSDVFHDRYVISSNDGGKSFSAPQLFNGLPETNENGVRRVYALNAFYHEKTHANYALGRMTSYADDKGPILAGKDTMRALTVLNTSLHR